MIKKYILLLGVLLYSYTAFTQVVTPVEEDEITPVEIVLGAQLANPYSVANMQTAYGNLSATNPSTPRLTINTTHKYVRFLPKDSTEFYMLSEIDTLDLFDHPLDYEIISEGNYYHDPTIDADKPTWYYAVVTNDYVMPATLTPIEYEELDDLFLPPDDVVGVAYDPFYDTLEDKSFEMLGVPNDMIEEAGRWNPSGQILVNNPINGPILKSGNKYDGVPNVVGRVRKWFRVKKAPTNNDGYFYISSRFRGKVNYGVIYKNSHARILPGPFSPLFFYYGGAFLDGPRKKGHWEYRSHKGVSSYKWGTIMRGVDDYHNIYGPNLGIGRPPNNLRIAAFQLSDVAFAPMLYKQPWLLTIVPWWLFVGTFADVYVDGKNDDYHVAYATVIHELGHAAHWESEGDWAYLLLEMVEDPDYHQSRMATEAWSDGIEKLASIDKFGFHDLDDDECDDLQGKIDDHYPEVIVQDLMDFEPSAGMCDIVDNVFGFTPSQIFWSLESSRYHALERWRDNLIALKPEQSENLREYFAQWIGEEFTPCSESPTILNTDMTSANQVIITNTNAVRMQPGFRFQANATSDYFRARIYCAFAEPPTSAMPDGDDTVVKTYAMPAREQLGKTVSVIYPIKDEPKQTTIQNGLDIAVLLYPNPADDSVIIESARAFVRYQIYNQYGSLMLEKNGISNNNVLLNIASLPSDVYIIQIEMASGETIQKRLIKR